MELSKTQKELVGRGALLLMGLMLLYGGWKCLAVSSEIRQSVNELRGESGSRTIPRTRRTGGASGLPFLIGIVLMAGGGLITLGAVLPTGTFEKMFGGAPKNVGLGQGHSWDDWKR